MRELKRIPDRLLIPIANFAAEMAHYSLNGTKDAVRIDFSFFNFCWWTDSRLRRRKDFRCFYFWGFISYSIGRGGGTPMRKPWLPIWGHIKQKVISAVENLGQSTALMFFDGFMGMKEIVLYERFRLETWFSGDFF